MTDPGYDYSHTTTHPMVRHLAQAFGEDRLLVGSDFPPSLDHLTVPQALTTPNHVAGLSERARAKIAGANLVSLVDEARAGATVFADKVRVRVRVRV